MVSQNLFEKAIQRIGAEVKQRGSCLVSEEELVFICEGAADDSERFACIRDLAMKHEWAFELDGASWAVAFKQLPA